MFPLTQTLLDHIWSMCVPRFYVYMLNSDVTGTLLLPKSPETRQFAQRLVQANIIEEQKEPSALLVFGEGNVPIESPPENGQ